MGIPLRVLIIEDIEDDAVLLVQELRSKGYDPLFERVDTQKAMQDALDRQTWDVVVCDYSMPGFNAISALELMHKIQNDLPFILVSGTIGEEVAVEAMKAGAHDYIMKDNLSRFVPAIQRELVEYKERCHVKQMEDAIQTLVKGTVGVTGQEFFDRIVSSICEWLGTDCTFIGQITNEVNVTALSMQLDRRVIYDYGYTIGGGPCEVVVGDGYYSYTDGVCKLYPDNNVLSDLKAEGYVGVSLNDKSGKAIGILWTVSRHKLNIPPRTADVMEIIAAKASAEIERLQAEADLQTSEERYRAVFEQAVSSNVVVDGDTGEIVEFNTHAHENLGYTRKEFESLKIADFDTIENHEDVRKHIDKIIRNGSDIFETKHRGKDGKIHDMIISAKLLSIPGRNIITSQWHDITERRQMEEELRKSEEGFRELAENIPEAFWVTSPDFKRIIYLSPAYETIWGHTCKSLYEHPDSWIDNVHSDDRDRVAAALENHTQGKADFTEEYRIIRPDGSERWIVDCAYSIKGKSGLIDHIIGVAKDITERKKAEEQIKASLREKEVLLKEIHHRVKNNMQIVSSLLNLQSESVDDESTRQIFKKSQNRVKSMALVHEKLYQTEDLSSIDFGEYTRSLTARLLHSFGDNTNGIQLVIDIDEVFLDVNKAIPCGLIINEIVSNSFKHAFPDSTTGADKNKFEGNGVIKVSMRKNADPVSRTSADVDTGIIELVVGDNGIGLHEGLDFRKTKTLGMELVITLVDQLDGSIEYVNNGGTEFKITFRV